jgi:gliding motility-associated-like protein
LGYYGRSEYQYYYRNRGQCSGRNFSNSGQGTTIINVTAPEGSGKGTIKVTSVTTSCSSAPVTFEADPGRAKSNLTIANVFSPNGDGVNDRWEIPNIQHFADNDLVIINRWGNEVYRSKAYQNNWDGSNLSAGTYFYVLKVKECDGAYKTYKGYVMIMR